MREASFSVGHDDTSDVSDHVQHLRNRAKWHLFLAANLLQHTKDAHFRLVVTDDDDQLEVMCLVMRLPA